MGFDGWEIGLGWFFFWGLVFFMVWVVRVIVSVRGYSNIKGLCVY